MRPLPVLLRRRFDVRLLRRLSQMSLRDLAQATGVRLHVLYGMEMGLWVTHTDAFRVLWVLSQRTGLACNLQDVRGLNIRRKKR